MAKNKKIIYKDMVVNKKLLTSQDIEEFFGLKSDFFSQSIIYLEKKSKVKEETYEQKYQYWKQVFRNIYYDSISEDLFLKHTYFALLLKSLVIINLSIIQNLDFEDTYEDYITNDLEALNIFEFGTFFYWTDFSKKVFETIYNIVEINDFALEDLFIDIYQQLFFSITRHKIGEFYTPNLLVKKMVDSFYDFGLKILDPSCGSGNFLIYIVIKILNSQKPDDQKIKALNKIYGFDINPLATMTAKVNMLLIYLEHFNIGEDKIPDIKIYLLDSLFPENFEKIKNIHLENLYNSFDLIIGNPPWLTYKDLSNKDYQIKIRDLAEQLEIKPSSQYITHIEIATIFFYFIPMKFLKEGGKVFFVITKSVLNGDHCYEFRKFTFFNNIEIWDFPKNYFFNINYICLKADYIGQSNAFSIKDKYPLKAKIFNSSLDLKDETNYSSLKIEKDGTKIIFPESYLKILNKISASNYKNKFYQGATLVPRTLVFFSIDKKDNDLLLISSDNDILLRAKKNWQYTFTNKEIEKVFRYKTFLNKDLIPFFLKKTRNVFLPIDSNYTFNIEYLKQFTKALDYYNNANEIYQQKKKNTSDIDNLFSNLNYWNKLTKQAKNKKYLVIYNASGSNIKAAVISNN
ncbi:MAG TPA: DNA methyltransferase, partial [Candidatus Lokiarchaeia archaeon]